MGKNKGKGKGKNKSKAKAEREAKKLKEKAEKDRYRLFDNGRVRTYAGAAVCGIAYEPRHGNVLLALHAEADAEEALREDRDDGVWLQRLSGPRASSLPECEMAPPLEMATDTSVSMVILDSGDVVLARMTMEEPMGLTLHESLDGLTPTTVKLPPTAKSKRDDTIHPSLHRYGDYLMLATFVEDSREFVLTFYSQRMQCLLRVPILSYVRHFSFVSVKGIMRDFSTQKWNVVAIDSRREDYDDPKLFTIELPPLDVLASIEQSAPGALSRKALVTAHPAQAIFRMNVPWARFGVAQIGTTSLFISTDSDKEEGVDADWTKIEVFDAEGVFSARFHDLELRGEWEVPDPSTQIITAVTYAHPGVILVAWRLRYAEDYDIIHQTHITTLWFDYVPWHTAIKEDLVPPQFIAILRTLSYLRWRGDADSQRAHVTRLQQSREQRALASGGEDDDDGSDGQSEEGEGEEEWEELVPHEPTAIELAWFSLPIEVMHAMFEAVWEEYIRAQYVTGKSGHAAD